MSRSYKKNLFTLDLFVAILKFQSRDVKPLYKFYAMSEKVERSCWPFWKEKRFEMVIKKFRKFLRNLDYTYFLSFEPRGITTWTKLNRDVKFSCFFNIFHDPHTEERKFSLLSEPLNEAIKIYFELKRFYEEFCENLDENDMIYFKKGDAFLELARKIAENQVRFYREM